MQIVEQMGSEDLLLFATDYPHWHYDTPEEALPIAFPEPLMSKVLHDNAQQWYRL